MRRTRNLALTVVPFLGPMALWEVAVRWREVPTFILPAPSAVAVALWRGLTSGLYLRHFWYTLVETLLGFLLGSALGFGLGTVVAMSRWVEYFLYPCIVMFQLMLETGIIKQAVTVPELITNELIDEINRLNPEKIAAEARAYRAGG